MLPRLYLLNPSTKGRMWQIFKDVWIFKQSKAGLNFKFSFA